MDTKEEGAQGVRPWEVDSTKTALQTPRLNGAAVPSMVRLLERRQDARYATNDPAEFGFSPRMAYAARRQCWMFPGRE